MKVRNGFVSNSSSSSFIIVGTDYEIEDVLVKLGYDSSYLERGIATFDGIVVVALEYNPFLYGMDIRWKLEVGERLPDLKKAFIELVKEKLGIDLPEDEVNLEFGMADS